MTQTNPSIVSGTGDAAKLKVWIESLSLHGGSEIRPTPTGVTAIVGSNNSGKTTLLSDIYAALTGRSYGVPEVVTRPMQIQRSGGRDDLEAWLSKHAQFAKNPQSQQMEWGRLGLSLPYSEIRTWDPSDAEISSSSPFHPSAQFWTHYFPADGYGGNFQSERAPVGTAPVHPLQVLHEQPALMAELSRICKDVFDEELILDDESPHLNLLVGRPEVEHPKHTEDKSDYRDALSRLRVLQAQGHGMRSWMSVITQLITGTFPIILADEPEVFLHPPQARALGIYLSRLAADRNCQVIIATHDRNLLAGLLEERSDLSVVRLVRTPDRTFAHQLVAERVRELWADPLLRYSNVLDGLFHKVVVVAEAHGDCTFYQAALEHHRSASLPSGEQTGESQSAVTQLPTADVMFAPSNGKQAMPKVVSALTAVKVPVVVTPDLDVLNPKEQTLQRLAEAIPADWATLEPEFRQATRVLIQASALNRVSLIRDAVAKAFETILQEDPNAAWDKETKKPVLEVLKAAGGPSEKLKHEGINYASGGDRTALNQLLDLLLEIGIVPVQLGELERFAPELTQNNKTVWLEQALESRAYTRPEVQAHILRLLTSARRKLDA